MSEFREKLQTLLDELKEKALSLYGERLVSLVVFGSVAKGLATPESDLDLLIILEDKPKGSYSTFMEYYENIESELKTLKELRLSISPIFLRKTSLKVELPWLWDNVFLILYDKDNFFKNFLNKLKEFKACLVYMKEPMPHYIMKKQ